MRYTLLRRGADDAERWVQPLWRPVPPSSRACCCLAAPVVQAVLPPNQTRTAAVELLLCGHHYRICRNGLADAGAALYDLAGLPLTPAVEPPASRRADDPASQQAAR